MRESLLEAFDEIYLLNLHGSAKKQETVADGSKDDNVFDITVGVAIAIFVKLPPDKRAKGKKKNATIHHADLWGLRKNKYDWLNGHNATNTEWTTFEPYAPDFRFVPRDSKYEKEYQQYWSVADIMPIRNTGIQTKRDDLIYHFTKKELNDVLTIFLETPANQIRNKLDLVEDGRDWQIGWAQNDLKTSKGQICQVAYHPFDFRWTYYTGNTKGFTAITQEPEIEARGLVFPGIRGFGWTEALRLFGLIHMTQRSKVRVCLPGCPTVLSPTWQIGLLRLG